MTGFLQTTRTGETTDIDDVDKDIQSINIIDRTVTLTNGFIIDFDIFMETYRGFWKQRIAGETLVPSAIEHFMRRTSGKNLSALMKGKKMEGYMEGSMDKLLTPGQKIAIGTIITLSFVGLIILIALKNQGMLPGF